jgi:ATP-dependent protease ClpP protease subunit
VVETLGLSNIYGIGHSAGATDLLLAANLGSDACLMTASRIMLHRAIVLREGQFSRAHTFVV